MKILLGLIIISLFSYRQNKEKEYKTIDREFLLCSLIADAINPSNPRGAFIGISYCGIKSAEKIRKLNEDNM